jgi:DNA-binding transcriptional MerR regulator
MKHKSVDELSGKLYYSISEVSEITGIKQYVLRFWEKEFSDLKPKKNRAGNRTYQLKDIELVNRIKNLLYEEGFTIEGARAQLKEFRHTTEPENKELDQENMKTVLKDIKKELSEILKILS